MKTSLHWRFLTVALFALALAGSGCGDSDSPGDPGPADTTPPAITGVVAVDMYHIEITFDEEVKKESAERDDNYAIVETASPSPAPGHGGTHYASPGDTIGIGSSILGTDKKTVMISTYMPMSDVPYDVSVRNVEDVHGNKLNEEDTESFTGVTTPDQTRPEIVFRSPAANATGVGTNQSVVVQFSEPMEHGTVFPAFSWKQGQTNVPVEMEEHGDNEYVFYPLQALNTNTIYTVTVTSTARDQHGNTLITDTWNFTTTPTVDVTPPTIVSSSPANNAVNVSVETNLRVTFSEAIDENSMEEVILTPDPGSGVGSLQNSGRTINFDPDDPLMDNTQYSLIFPQGSIRDLSGNGLAETVSITFTTGPSLASGAVSGTVTGDPSSSAASDPAGAIVVALLAPPTNEGIDAAGSGTVAGNGDYTIDHLPDGVYFPMGILDSNGDGELSPETGDAIGANGYDPTDLEPVIIGVIVSGGSTVPDVDFQLFDPSAISGNAIYDGSEYASGEYPFYIGVFDTTGFDISNDPQTVAEDMGYYPYDPEYDISEFESDLTPGTYYVGAFMDVNGGGQYDPAIDPAGFYGGEVPTPITLANGSDALEIDIIMEDPAGGQPRSITWRGKPNHRSNSSQVRILDALQRTVEAQ